MSFIWLGLVFLLEVFCIFSCGTLFIYLTGKKNFTCPMAVVSGFFLYFTLFEAVALPMTLLGMSLTALGIVWIVIALGMNVWAVAVGRKLWAQEIKGILYMVGKHPAVTACVIVCVLIQMAIVFIHMDYSPDAAYYVGQVSTDVYTDTLARFDPYTGSMRSGFKLRYLFSTFPDYNAVCAKMLFLHPLKQAKVVMPEIIIVTANLIYYQIGKALFREDYKRSAYLVIFVFIINLYSNTIYTTANFLLFRTYEGKAILGNLIIPCLFLCMIKLYQEKADLTVKLLMLVCGCSSVTFSSSSMMLIPVAVSAGALPYIVLRKRFKMIGWYLVWVLPVTAAMILYFLLEKGILNLKF